jgi:hypothetical protein
VPFCAGWASSPGVSRSKPPTRWHQARKSAQRISPTAWPIS